MNLKCRLSICESFLLSSAVCLPKVTEGQAGDASLTQKGSRIYWEPFHYDVSPRIIASSSLRVIIPVVD